MAAFLARASLSVAMAHDGAIGIARARRYPPRVALLDYNLPDYNLPDLAEKLRAAFPEMAILTCRSRR
jgi:DNA-binding response OmpR family regulator